MARVPYRPRLRSTRRPNMTMDSEEADAESRGDGAIVSREQATLLAAFLPIFRLLEVRAALGFALAKSVGEATEAIVRFSDAIAQDKIPVDPAVAAWNKFITD